MRTGIRLAIVCLAVTLLLQPSLTFTGEDVNKYTVILLKRINDPLPNNDAVAKEAFSADCSVYSDGTSCSKQIPEDQKFSQAATKLACIVNNGQGIQFFSFAGEDALWTLFTTGTASGLTGNAIETVCNDNDLDQYSEVMIGVLTEEVTTKSTEFEAAFVSNSQTQGVQAFDATFSSTMVDSTKHQVEVEYQVPAAYSQVRIQAIMEINNTIQGQQYWSGNNESWFCHGLDGDNNGLDSKDPVFGSSQKFILEIEQDVLEGTYGLEFETFNEGRDDEFDLGMAVLKLRYIDCRENKILGVFAANYNIKVDTGVDLTITARTDRVDKQLEDLDIDVLIPSTFLWCDEETCESPFFLSVDEPREGIVGQTMYAMIVSQTTTRTLVMKSYELKDEDDNLAAGFANVSTVNEGKEGKLILSIEILSVFDVATLTFTGHLVLPDSGRLLAEEEEEEEVQGVVATGQFSASTGELPDNQTPDADDTSDGATNLLATGVTLLYLLLSLFYI